MSDLFNERGTGPQAPSARKPVSLHSDTDIYRAVTELAMFVTKAATNMRRDVKPLLGKLLVDETVWMGVVILRANKAREAAKLPHLEELIEQTEIVQMALRIARECGYVANSTFTDSIPLTASVARQATALRNRFAPAS